MLGGVNVASVLVHVLEWLMLPLYVYVLGGWWVIATSVHVNVYVLGGQCCLCSCPCIGGQCCLCSCPCVCFGGAAGNCCLCSFPCVCVREVGINVASVHLHMYVLREGQCCPCSCPCVRTINVASGHVYVYVFGGGKCCRCSCRLYPCQCACA